MSRTASPDSRVRRRPTTTAEIDRSTAATGRLLSSPTDWLRRLHCARLDVVLEAPSSSGLSATQRRVLELEGFEPLCGAVLRQPAPTGRTQRRVEVWVDPTTTIRAEVVGRRIYFVTLFDDGSSLLSLPDPTAAQWLRSSTCEALCGTGDLRTDLARFRERAREHQRSDRSALLCGDGATYRTHLLVTALHGSKHPGARRLGPDRLWYPMTLMLAAEIVARCDAHADRVGLPDFEAIPCERAQSTNAAAGGGDGTKTIR